MPYRDDRGALESRRDDLRRELDELRPRTAALREMVRLEETVVRELAVTEARLAHIEARRASLLDEVSIASPCKADWDEMTGDARVRYCGQCDKHVYNLSAMSREEATALLAEREGRLCVRLYRREDGTVLTADCPVGRRRKRVRLALYGLAGAGALSVATMAAASTVMMGDMAGPRVRQPVRDDGPEIYVQWSPQRAPERGLVFVYRREAQQGRPAVRWKLWADGHATRAVGDHEAVEVELSLEGLVAAREIRAFAAELRTEAMGAVSVLEGSAVSRRYELLGKGTRAATDDDRETLFALGRQLAVEGESR